MSRILTAGVDPCVIGPRTIAGNFAADLDGYEMSGPGIWGTGDSWLFPLEFQPPAGYRVRILGITGDVTARLTTRGTGPAIANEGEFVGFLAGVQTSAPEGSQYADLAADNTLVYVQGDISPALGAAVRTFDQDLRGIENTLLEPDHKLWFKVAPYLNETGLPIHFEITFSSVRFQFECE